MSNEVTMFAGAGGLQVFNNSEFGEIRTVVIDDAPWFVGRDIAVALGYSVPQKAIADHVDTEDKQLQKFQNGTLENIPNRGLTIINESGLYSLVLGSKLPTAKKFKRWITSDVIPTIRKQGAYLTLQAAEKVLSDPDFIISLATKVKDETARHKQAEAKALEAEKQVLSLSAQVTQMKPKVDYCDRILSSPEAVTITQIAADYNMSAKAMNAKLHDLGIQHKVNDQWVLYVEYMNKGYVRSATFNVTKSNGTQVAKMNTMWTQKGRLFLYDKLKAVGVLPLMETLTATAQN